MNDADRKLQATANTQARLLVALAVIVFGLSLNTYGGLERYTGTMYTLALVGGILQTIALPAVCLSSAASLRRAARNAHETERPAP